MKIDLKVLSNNSVQTTGLETEEMGLSSEAQSIVFKMFTEGVYKNSIGSVVREITSNCFDSHAEAKVKTPVVVKRSFDTASDTHYISFIDYGVGMSPERVKTVYAVYFNSTKRDNNEEIGGFGIGGKTPLAYKRSTGFGEGDFDNSFFVITNYNGTQYYYNIFMGKKAPTYVLMDSVPTDERNGTEIRIPVLSKDWDKFEAEIVKQLYYFDNLIFEGFKNPSIENEYKIVRGKNFLYRGTKVSSYMHVCLGKVAYPIDFDQLGLDAYDYDIPVAINVPIGDIGVVVSREEISYTEATIKYLKKRIEDVMNELREMLSKKYDNVHNLKDYFNAKQNFGMLEMINGEFLDLRSLIKQGDVDYTNYKYNSITTPDSSALFRFFFNVNVYGKKELKGYSRNKDFEYLKRDYNTIGEISNVLFAEDASFPRKRIVQAWLKQQYGRFYTITKCEDEFWYEKELSNVFNVDNQTDLAKDTFMKMVLEMQEEYFQIVRENAKGGDYTKIDVPAEFIESRKVQRVTEEMKKITIPVNFVGGHSRQRIKLKDFFNFTGVVFYGTKDDEHKLNRAYRLFVQLFDTPTVSSYGSWYDDGFSTRTRGYGGRNSDDSKAKAMFIQIAKGNVQYMPYKKNAYHVDQFFVKMLHRKTDLVETYFANKTVLDNIKNVNEFSRNILPELNTKWAKQVGEVMDFYKEIKALERYDNLQYNAELLKGYINVDVPESKEAKQINKKINKIADLQKKNSEILNFMNMPYDVTRISDSGKVILFSMLKKVMSF
jgi:hypothetical protein